MSDARTSKLAEPSVESKGSLALLVSHDRSVSTVVIPETGVLSLGRGDACEVRIEDDSVSRSHAVIRCGHPPTIEDAGSTNGTRILGRTLAAGERATIGVGSVIRLGTALLLVQHATDAVTSIGSSTGPKPPPGGLLFEDATMKQLYNLIGIVAPTPMSVLILGETGVGKEVVAEAIHKGSARADKPFLKLNCAALAESILESELFGHERGAFTGAVQAKVGLFESAHGGTVFLDELGELPLTTQAKLLRVLEYGEVTRLGSVKAQKIDFRLVSATNRDLQARIGEGQFRRDLFFRVNGFSLTIPSLRERKDDILALGRHFLSAARYRLGKPEIEFSVAAVDALLAHDWPGNIRELRNYVERAALLVMGRAIEPSDLTLKPAVEAMAPRPAIRSAPSAHPPPPTGPVDPDTTQPTAAVNLLDHLKEQYAELERAKIVEALNAFAGNQSLAAKHLGIHRATLVRRIDEYGIPRPKKGR